MSSVDSAAPVDATEVIVFRQIVVAALLISLSLCCRTSADEEPQPPAHRLPPVGGDQPSAGAWDRRDLVLFAGGAVQIRPPLGWLIREVPYGREVRLVVVPADRGRGNSMPADGIWISCHPRPSPQQNPEAELLSQIRQRTHLAIGQAATLKQPSLYRFAGWPAVELEFEKPPADNMAAVRGSHILVRPAWGLCELHISTYAEMYDQRLVEFQRLLNDLHLVEPRQPNRQVIPAVAAAQEILGTWKAYRSRLRLSGNGQIEIDADRARQVGPDSTSGRADYVKMSLRGRFHAERDLLYVVWDDGSKLNFRWNLSGGDLLLTDHEGQISQLRRLFE